MLNNILLASVSPDSSKTHFLEGFSGSADGNHIYPILTCSQQVFFLWLLYLKVNLNGCKILGSHFLFLSNLDVLLNFLLV